MIFSTTRALVREEIRRSDLRRNLLRICARGPRTIHDLIHAPSYPGITTNLFTIQSELGVTIELGECKNRELLVRVGRVPDPVVPEGYTELLRTSLLGFLLSPELAYAEPEAYALYLDRWFASPSVTAGLGAHGPLVRDLFLAFPELASRMFFVAEEGSERRAELPFNLEEREWIRVFGLYHLADLPTRPQDLPLREWLAALRTPPLAEGWARLGQDDWGALGRRRLLLSLSRLLGRRPLRSDPAPYEIQALKGPELVEDRLRPFPLRGPTRPGRRTSPTA